MALEAVLQVHTLFLCLSCSEAHSLHVASKGVGICTRPSLRPCVRRELAYRVIARRVRNMTRARRWMDAVLRDAIHHHWFPNRMRINLQELEHHFNCGIQGNEALVQKTSFWKGPLPACPFCHDSKATAAVYSAEGDKMRTSHPCLNFGCRLCLQRALSRSFRMGYGHGELYHDPEISEYPVNRWDPLTWRYSGQGSEDEYE